MSSRRFQKSLVPGSLCDSTGSQPPVFDIVVEMDSDSVLAGVCCHYRFTSVEESHERFLCAVLMSTI